MTDDQRVPNESKLAMIPGKMIPGKLELRRLLLEQFHEDSVDRNGLGSPQVRILSRLLIPSGSASTHRALR